MSSDDEFAQWAKQFVNTCAETGSFAEQMGAAPGVPTGVQYSGVTQAANDLLRAVDAGGVPAFVSAGLKQIAEENGIAVGTDSTPNQIVEALRAKSLESTAKGSQAGG